MDWLITSAARALAAGDPFGALNWVGLREDASALALRGIAMAQLGDLVRARELLRAAARAFGPKEGMARARCVVAEAEIALATRELNWPVKSLEAARRTLEAQGDRVNAAHASTLAIRRLLLIGQLDEADRLLATLTPSTLPSALRTTYHLAVAGIAMRRLQAKAARSALTQAEQAARQAGIPALLAEVDGAMQMWNAPTARLIAGDAERLLSLTEVEDVLTSQALVVDACRHTACVEGRGVSMVTRPVLFALARALAEAWPADVPRDGLMARAFRARHTDESHRVRLRVEIGRLRTLLASFAEIRATKQGFTLAPLEARDVVVLARPAEEAHAQVLALLCDGESWSSSALALALDTGQRTVQRMLEALAEQGKVQAIGRGRARRWSSPPMPGFATALLLPTQLTRD